jgi:hypothetical protein
MSHATTYTTPVQVAREKGVSVLSRTRTRMHKGTGWGARVYFTGECDPDGEEEGSQEGEPHALSA